MYLWIYWYIQTPLTILCGTHPTVILIWFKEHYNALNYFYLLTFPLTLFFVVLYLLIGSYIYFKLIQLFCMCPNLDIYFFSCNSNIETLLNIYLIIPLYYGDLWQTFLASHHLPTPFSWAYSPYKKAKYTYNTTTIHFSPNSFIIIYQVDYTRINILQIFVITIFP